MKTILFCTHEYAFGILKPLNDELLDQKHEVLWFVAEEIRASFPFTNVSTSSSIKNLFEYNSDVIFVPGNEVPHYLRGVKVQVFHGMAGEKSGHFRIRNYFDLYLTQGPYFTDQFNKLALQHRDFEVQETGWCKLDPLFQEHAEWNHERTRLLTTHGKKKILLYAPTFSPSLTSATIALKEILQLADHDDYLLIVKFHDLVSLAVINEYKAAAKTQTDLLIAEDHNILQYLMMSDLLISDTSSAVYEFMVLDKPVVTINSRAKNIRWHNITNIVELPSAVESELIHDPFREKRVQIIKQYHPYKDGKSSARMIAAVEDYIQRNGIQRERKINLWRSFKINRMFGSKPS